jgi:CheY-like chemotaxis protein
MQLSDVTPGNHLRGTFLPHPTRWNVLTVMVVDDDPDVRRVTARMLQHAGYATVEAGDGAEALRRLQHADVPIHAIISDVMMPRLTGTELVARLMVSRPALPMILMSAYSIEELRARGLYLSTVPLLTKPFNKERLVNIVRAVLDVSAPARDDGSFDRNSSARSCHRET